MAHIRQSAYSGYLPNHDLYAIQILIKGPASYSAPALDPVIMLPIRL